MNSTVLNNITNNPDLSHIVYDKQGRVISYTVSNMKVFSKNNISYHKNGNISVIEEVKNHGTNVFKYDVEGRIIYSEIKSTYYSGLRSKLLTAKYAYDNSSKDAAVVISEYIDGELVGVTHKDKNDRQTYWESIVDGVPTIINTCKYDKHDRLIFTSTNDHRGESCLEYIYNDDTLGKEIKAYSFLVPDENYLKKIERYDRYGRELYTCSLRKTGFFERYYEYHGRNLVYFQEISDGKVLTEFRVKYICNHGYRIEYAGGEVVMNTGFSELFIDEGLNYNRAHKDARLVEKVMKSQKFYR